MTPPLFQIRVNDVDQFFGALVPRDLAGVRFGNGFDVRGDDFSHKPVQRSPTCGRALKNLERALVFKQCSLDAVKLPANATDAEQQLLLAQVLGHANFLQIYYWSIVSSRFIKTTSI